MDTDTMMPPVPMAGDTDEERKRRQIASVGGMPPATLATANARLAEMSPGFSGAAMDAARGNADGNAQDSERFGHLDEMVRQAHLRRAATLAEKAMRAAPSAAPTMPPVGFGSVNRSEAFAGPSAQPQPTMPPVVAPKPQPAASTMPPVTLPLPKELQPLGRDYSGAGAAPVQPGATPTMPPVPVGKEMQAYQDLAAKGEPKLPMWKKALDVIGSIFPIGRAVETAIPGSPQNYDFKLNQAAIRAAKEQMLGKGEQEAETSRAQAQFNTPEKREVYMRQHPEQFEDMTKFEKDDWRVTGKFPQREPTPKTERPENLDREAYDYYIGQGMTPADARKRVLQDAQSVKPERQTHTSAFEAFAYGTPEEKKAAQDYLDFEKKVGARYKTPSEFDERYRLFKEDPDTYRAMFGDKSGGGPDRATATKMLNYFDKRRREVQNDFMLDDQQKAQQLQDIEGLEKPFMDAVQPGAAVGPANAGGGPTHPGDKHRVSVIAPDGTEGTVPLRQLKAAKEKGYKVKVTP